MNQQYELEVWQQDELVVGIDEAGRGPLAGPVVVCGVILPKHYSHPVIFDSKKLSIKKRNACFQDILNDAIWIGIEIVDEQTIDQFNIYRATQMAMERLAERCQVKHVLTDAMPLISRGLSVTSLIKGDQLSISIAAASIVAKVLRDAKMTALDKVYPAYGFAKHKGYGTKEHMLAIEQHGPLPIHRKSFEPIRSLCAFKLDI